MMLILQTWDDDVTGLGANRNIWIEWRYLHNTFGVVGLLSLSTEATLEIGCVGCPLQEPFHPMGPLTTNCWL